MPEWQQIALYAGGAALVLLVIQRIPYIGRVVRVAISFGLLALCIFLLIQQAPYNPNLARVVSPLGLDRQKVSGHEVRIRMSGDGQFWVDATLNGVRRRMLIDSGATITAISASTAATTSVESDPGFVPVILRTANGLVQARTGSIEELRIEGIQATNLKVVISPSLGNLDVLGMNFLSKLESWKVEGRTLTLTPRGEQID